MRKQLFSFLSILVLMSLLLTACDGGATEAPTEEATEAPTEEATEELTEEPTEEAEPEGIHWHGHRYGWRGRQVLQRDGLAGHAAR